VPSRIWCHGGDGLVLDQFSHLPGHEGFVVSVINPAQAHHFAKAPLKRTKTDAIDAQTLDQLAMVLQPEPWKPPPQAMIVATTWQTSSCRAAGPLPDGNKVAGPVEDIIDGNQEIRQPDRADMVAEPRTQGSYTSVSSGLRASAGSVDRCHPASSTAT